MTLHVFVGCLKKLEPPELNRWPVNQNTQVHVSLQIAGAGSYHLSGQPVFIGKGGIQRTTARVRSAGNVTVITPNLPRNLR